MLFKLAALLAATLSCFSQVLTSPTPSNNVNREQYRSSSNPSNPITYSRYGAPESTYEGNVIDHLEFHSQAYKGLSEERPIPHPSSKIKSVASLDLSESDIVPKWISGQALTDHFFSVFDNEKKWLRGVVNTRIKLLNEFKRMLNRGITPLQIRNMDNADLAHLHTFRELLEEMAGHHTRLQVLYKVAGRYRARFDEYDHGKGVREMNSANLSAMREFVFQFEVEIRKILAWTDTAILTQLERRMHPVHGPIPAQRLIDQAKFEAEMVAQRLA